MFMTKKDRKIANQKVMIDNRDKTIERMSKEKCLFKEQLREQRTTIEEQEELLAEIADRAFSCPLDSEKIVLNKIKELARDYQSTN